MYSILSCIVTSDTCHQFKICKQVITLCEAVKIQGNKTMLSMLSELLKMARCLKDPKQNIRVKGKTVAQKLKLYLF